MRGVQHDRNKFVLVFLAGLGELFGLETKRCTKVVDTVADMSAKSGIQRIKDVIHCDNGARNNVASRTRVGMRVAFYGVPTATHPTEALTTGAGRAVKLVHMTEGKGMFL